MKEKFNDGKHWTTTCIYLLIIVVAIFLIAQVFSIRVKRTVLNQFHLNQQSFKMFAAIHFIPPMYSFANEVWYTHRLVDFSEIEKNSTSKPEIIHYWVNHYPLRFVTFSIFGRRRFFLQQRPQYIYVRSKYMNVTLKSIYELQQSPRGLVMKKIE